MTFFSMYCIVAQEKTWDMAPSIQDGFLMPDDWGVGITYIIVGEKVQGCDPMNKQSNKVNIPCVNSKRTVWEGA